MTINTQSQEVHRPSNYGEETPIYVYQGMNPPPRRESKSASARFCQALAVAFGIWFLFEMAAGAIFWRHRHRWTGWAESSGPFASDGKVIQCDLAWTSEHNIDQNLVPGSGSPPYSSSLSATLPATSPLLYFLARGSYSSGAIRFEVDDRLKDNDKVAIQVDARYWSLAVRDEVNICLLENNEGGRGFGIFTPRYRVPRNWHDEVRFTITVRFPASLKHPLSLNTLTTNLPTFRHELADLDGSVTFKSLSLRGSNAGVVTRSVSARFLDIQTSNAPITGTYNASDRLSLVSSNGHIDVHVHLSNEHHDHGKPSLLNLVTNNARLLSRISLYSIENSKEISSGGQFDLKAHTTNGRTDISFPTSPHTSGLNLNVRTSNAATGVSLHPAFEGSISLRTSNSVPELEQGKATDPSGQGRKRFVEVRRFVKGMLDASVSWGSSREDKKRAEASEVVVTTSNGKNLVSLA